MRLHSLVTCASVLALSTAALSQAHPHARPQVTGAADQEASTHFSVFLPLTNQAALEQLVIDQTSATSPGYHKWLTPAQFKTQFGPRPSDIAKVEQSLEAAGFTITAEHTQSIDVEGTVAAVEHLFATRLQLVRMPKGNTRFAAFDHRITLPAELASVGAVIPEFNPGLLAHVHSERVNTSAAHLPLTSGTGTINQRLGSADSFFYPDDMNQAYDFPAFTTKVVPFTKLFFGSPVQLAGLGSTIGILISSTISQADIKAAFHSTISTSGTDVDVQNFSAYTTIPVPVVTIDPVLGGSGPFNPNSDDAFEASLDTQMSLGTAPGAHEVLYDIPDLTDDAIIAGYTQIDDENKVDVVSSSFGECELDFTPAANGGVDYTGVLKTFHSLFLQGNSQGITFVASSGDNGAPACNTTGFDNHPSNGTNFILGVENPASDPAVTGVGGTNLQVAAYPTPNDNLYVSENANYDPRVPAEYDINGNTYTVGNNTWGSGGGYSIIFSKPPYQQLVRTGSNTARAVPDVSLMMGGCPGDADLAKQDCTVLPRSASIVWIGGVPYLLIGTSSSSPQMAGVIALSVELAGTRLGNINPLIYILSALQTALGSKGLTEYFHRNISGNNNGYTVSPGQAYSTVLGNGTLFVKNFLQLQNALPAGTPDTPTNP